MKNKLMLMLGIILLVLVSPFVMSFISEIDVTSPIGGDVWSGKQSITWTAVGCTGAENVTVQYARGETPPFASYINITPTINCSLTPHEWDTTNLTDGTDYFIRVVRTDNYAVYDHSGKFTINNTIPPDQPTLNSPTNNSVVYGTTATLNITVTDDNDDYLDVSFYNETMIPTEV